MTPIKGEEYFVAWRSGDLKVTCQVEDKEIYTKASLYKCFSYNDKPTQNSLIDLLAIQSNVFVWLV